MKKKYPRYQSGKDAAKRQRKVVKGRVPQAGPSRKKHKAKDPFYADAKDTYLACRQHERQKPLRPQLFSDYMKAVYDPDPDL